MNEIKLARLADHVQRRYDIPASSIMALFDVSDLHSAHNMEKLFSFPEMMDVVLDQARAAKPLNKHISRIKAQTKMHDAVDVLAALCNTKSLQRSLFLSDGVLDVLVSRIRDGNRAVALTALDRLLNRRENCKQVTPPQLGSMVTALLNNASRSSLQCLVKLAQERTNRALIVKSQPEIINLLFQLEGEYRDECCDILALLACDAENVQSMVFERNDILPMFVRECASGREYVAYALQFAQTGAVLCTCLDCHKRTLRFWQAAMQIWALASARTFPHTIGKRTAMRCFPHELRRLTFCMLA